MLKETILNIVPGLREKAGVTQQSLAEAVGVTRQTIFAIERGQYIPSLLLAMKIARFFRRSIEDIFKIGYEK
jgi:putative transcriptional regulator